MQFSKHFCVKADNHFRLDNIATDYTDQHKDKSSALVDIHKYAQRLRELQLLLYAENKRGLLICLQALDTGGKDGTIKHVLGYMNPQGCRVQSFKAPTAEEAAHDFLWRVHKVTPAHGEVVIFNRSHYEDVLVVRVHDLVAKNIWSQRYDTINAFEKHLADNGVHILKFFLHISMGEQLKRFKKRIEDPSRQWKISEADYTERPYWNAYQHAYEEALQKCSTDWAPWFVIPSDHKWFRNLAISRIVVEYLEALNMEYPKPHVDIEAIKKKYHAEVERQKK